MREELLKFLKQNKKKFQKQYHISKIGIFGSVAKGIDNEKSDIDIIVEFDNAPDIYESKISIQEIIKNNFRREVDICHEKYLKSFIRDKILSETVYV